MTLITSGGEILKLTRKDADFDGIVVGLGALGVVTRLTLDVEPAFEVSQRVFERLPWEALSNLDAIMSSGYSVSVFTHLGEVAEQVWVKRRTDAGEKPLGDELFGACAAAEQVHMITGMPAEFTTAQLDTPGAWLDRLPHFRMQFTPSSGEELQSEFLVPRRHGLEALEAVRSLAHMIGPLLQVCEIRTVAGDQLWMSTAYGASRLAIHFTWKPDQPGVERVLGRIEDALEPFGARPHWGKVFLMDAAAIGELYPRLGDFRELRERLDPRGAFHNPWLERHVLGATH
jgi:xylitol oxidase